MTGSSVKSQLTALQREFLAVFAERTSSYFLTGGAVLAGWILGHRRTDDLDLFTTDDDAMAEGDLLVRGVADTIGATVEAVRTSPDFRRYLVRRGADGVVVGLVRERVPQLRAKEVRDGVPMDSVEEIVANKICAHLGRAEIRDLVDLYWLERAGFPVERFLEDAQRKDAGVTPGTLAWLLSEFAIPEDPPGEIDTQALRAYAQDLEARMRRLALPGQ